MGVTLDTGGLDAFLAGLDTAIDTGEERGAGYIKDLAAQLAPKDTNDLSESGLVEPNPDGGRRVVFGRDLPDIRAVAQELGTLNQEAQPYLGPAAAEIDVSLEIAKELTALAARSGV
jgi:hypothetical protein